MTRYWLGVVSRSHVARGVAGGFAQLCHGKAAPLKRMRSGDYLIYYSPKTEMNGGEPLQMFTAIGIVADDLIYQYVMSADFVPYRRNIQYQSCQAAPIKQLISQLEFIKDPQHWGAPLRFGHLEISAADFQLIATAMQTTISPESHDRQLNIPF